MGESPHPDIMDLFLALQILLSSSTARSLKSLISAGTRPKFV